MTKKAVLFSLVLGSVIGISGVFAPNILSTRTVLITIGLFALTVTLFSALFLFIHKYIFKGAPYLPTTAENISSIINLGKFTPRHKIAELGSGDGRVIKMIADSGAQIHGYEINPLLVLISKLNLISQKNVKIFAKNFWDRDFSEYDAVILFGVGYIMKKLESKLLSELKPGAIILSNRFEFPSLTPVKKENDIFLYKIE